MNDETREIWPTLNPFYYQPELFNLSRNEFVGNKNTFSQFKNNSYKIVTVSESQFELISRGCISAVIINEPAPPEIQENNYFILTYADAAMIAHVERHYPSSIAGRVVIEFNLVQKPNRAEQIHITEPAVERFMRRFCDQQ
ncbi:hypothetical protein J3U22_03140 [Gilliamella sp. B2865]|uniref:hypothetical protein n=1 Tax=Gilliamella sp. B2865 TaxID=2817984 RepID=UPI00226ABDA7|nr:hypothetical protein [Gilliamella sp. B2865]MCX8678591.1 hypothetical protein [Gilliamella sp. B2865]